MDEQMKPEQSGDSAPRPTQAESGVDKLVGGLKDIFGGLMHPAERGIRPAGAKNSFKLRYSGGEEREIFDDEIGEDLPTVAEAFTEYAGDLGLDPNRSCTYRDGQSVVDGATKVEWGHTYVASVQRATKGS